LFSRVAYSTRWDKRNLYVQDSRCNLRHEYDFMPLLKYAESVWGVKGIDDLHREYETPRKWTNPQLAELLAERKAELE
jgi:hypothetical protein